MEPLMTSCEKCGNPRPGAALYYGVCVHCYSAEADALRYALEKQQQEHRKLLLEHDQANAAKAQRRKVVCLVGSTRFEEQFIQANFDETMLGNIVLSVGFAPGNRHGQSIGITPEQKFDLDALHLSKVELADEVLVVNVNGYIGRSTKFEIEYARALKKPVRFMFPHNS